MDEVFKALADPSRRDILDRLRDRSGRTLGDLCEGLAMSRQAASKHLTTLERANLVVTRWRGRQKLHYLNPVPIQQISDRWIGRFARMRTEALVELKQALEEEQND